MAKVAFIGAGSVEFTRNLVTDLCSLPHLRGSLEFALHDIDGRRLDHAAAMTRRIVDQTSAAAAVTSIRSRRATSCTASAVVATSSPGRTPR